jgi:uncharacterized membrane protein YcaP (DUF421 family)
MASANTKTKQQDGAESDLAFHRREWRLERIGWAGIAIVLLLALAGVFGGGLTESVGRGVAVYLFILLLLRVAGKRTLAQITTFDFVLLLTISEAAQPALTGPDPTMLDSAIVVMTLIALTILMSWLKERSKTLDRILDDIPLIIVADGKPLADRMAKVRIDESDVLDAARESQGIEHMEQIRHAILERNGKISIIPKRE